MVWSPGRAEFAQVGQLMVLITIDQRNLGSASPVLKEGTIEVRHFEADLGVGA